MYRDQKEANRRILQKENHQATTGKAKRKRNIKINWYIYTMEYYSAITKN